MSLWLVTLLLAAASFLLGAVPCGLIVGLMKGVDVRKIGSGNVGAMNVGRILGRRWFITVFLLDMVKGLIPTLLGGMLIWGAAVGSGASESVRNLCWLVVGMCSVLGHNYSPFLGFKGGKGVSTSLGVALGVYPDLTVPALLSFVVWVIGVTSTRMSSVGSMSGGVLFPVFYVVAAKWNGSSLSDRWPFLLFALTAAVLVLVRHRANIVRILSGKETKVVWPSNDAPTPTGNQL